MFSRRVQNVACLLGLVVQESTADFIGKNNFFCGYSTLYSCTELPRKLKRTERKPLVRSINELKREARLKKKEIEKVHEVTLHPPENGLLVKELVPVAHDVYAARSDLLACVSRVVEYIPLYSCSLCGEVHVGHPPHIIKTCNVAGSLLSKEHSWIRGGVDHVLPLVESFHLYDRIGRAVSHNERLEVDRIPAIVELCVQAGVDISEYLTRRRTVPVYSIVGRTVDFEQRFPKNHALGEDINPCSFWHKKKTYNKGLFSIDMHSDDVQAIAVRGMNAWEKMIRGVSQLMQKYAVHTCGYCPEVQVGPKGHRVRNCQAYKHQMRDGQHAWQEARINDVVPIVHVWHVRDPQSGKPLVDRLKRYYGMLPAVVELFAQAGAQVGKDFSSLMREDIAVPELDEEKLVV